MNNYEKMREALYSIQEYAAAMDPDDGNVLAILDACRDAPSELPRNCDVGTAEEQEDRFLDFCSEHHDTGCYDCDGNPICPVASESECRLAWAQMPYEEEGTAQ